MATGLPSTPKWEIEFVSGTWTDVTADVQDGATISSRGRTSETGTTQPSSVSITLDNALGKYTPRASVLADGVTAAPYYPNVVPRKRLRFSYVASATTYTRGVWYITAWQPQAEGAVRPVVVVSAADRMDQFGRFVMASEIEQSLTNAGANRAYWWPLNDPQPALGQGQVTATAAGNSANVMTVTQFGTGGSIIAGSIAGPAGGNGATAFAFGPASATNAAALTWSPAGSLAQYGASAMFQVSGVPSWRMDIMANDGLWAVSINTSGTLELQCNGTLTDSGFVADGKWHLVTVVYQPGALGATYLYRDAALVGHANLLLPDTTGGTFIVGNGSPVLAGTSNPGHGFSGNLANVVLGNLNTDFSLNLAVSGKDGYPNESPTTRISRLAGYAGVTSGNYDLSYALLDPYPQAGKTVLQGIQDAAASEGGGAAVYIAPDGRLRLRDRHARTPGAPVLTIDADRDVDGSVWAPTLDDATLTNQVTVSRASGTSTVSSQVASDATSQAAYGVIASDLTVYNNTDLDALNVAQWLVAQRRTPALRLSKVRVDLASAENNLYASLPSVEIGSRIRITNLPAKFWPATQVDLIVEGWTETPSVDGYVVEFDTTPADNPTPAIWSDTTYFRWQPVAGTLTLNASITRTATSLALATAAGNPTMTTVSTAYTTTPLDIKIDEEIIGLTAAPGGSTSPQSYTSVTRGKYGTTAAAHTAGATVSLWPAVTWAL